MKKAVIFLLFIVCSCVSKTPYQWLDQEIIDQAIVRMNIIVDEMNKELAAISKKQNLEIIEKVPYITKIEVSLDGKKIRVHYSHGIAKVSRHHEFSQHYQIGLEGSYRDKFGTDTSFSRVYFLENK